MVKVETQDTFHSVSKEWMYFFPFFSEGKKAFSIIHKSRKSIVLHPVSMTQTLCVQDIWPHFIVLLQG